MLVLILLFYMIVFMMISILNMMNRKLKIYKRLFCNYILINI